MLKKNLNINISIIKQSNIPRYVWQIKKRDEHIKISLPFNPISNPKQKITKQWNRSSPLLLSNLKAFGCFKWTRERKFSH